MIAVVSRELAAAATAVADAAAAPGQELRELLVDMYPGKKEWKGRSLRLKAKCP